MPKHENVALSSDLIMGWDLKYVTRRTEMLALATYIKYRGMVSQKVKLVDITLETLAKIIGVSKTSLKRFNGILEEKKLILVDRRKKGVTIHLLEYRGDRFFTVPVPVALAKASPSYIAVLIILHWYSIVRRTTKVQISLKALSARLGMSARAISRILQELSASGVYLERLKSEVNQPELYRVLKAYEIVAVQKRQCREPKNDSAESPKTTYVVRVPKVDNPKVDSYTTYKREETSPQPLPLTVLPEGWRFILNDEGGFDFMSNYEREQKVVINERQVELEEEVRRGSVDQWGHRQFFTLFRMRYERMYQTTWPCVTSAKDQAIMKRLVALNLKLENKEQHGARLIDLRDRINFLFNHWPMLKKVMKLTSAVPNVSILSHFGDNFAGFQKNGFPEIDGDRDYNLKNNLGKGEGSLKKDLTGPDKSITLDPGSDEMDKFLNS